MEPQKNKKVITLLKSIPLMACAIFIILFLISGKEVTVGTILDYTPKAPVAAAFIILLFYALKSVSFVFPIAVLQIATGRLFRIPAALLINFTGRAVTLSVPYWIGRLSGSGLLDRLQKKYPALEAHCSGRGKILFLFLSCCAHFVFYRGTRSAYTLALQRYHSHIIWQAAFWGRL